MNGRIFLIALLVIGSCGCASRKDFIRSCDYDVGKAIWQAGVPDPVSIEPVDDRMSRYIFEYEKSGCRWAYIVDNQTKQVLSWQFISDPKRCYVTTDYLGPW